MLNTLPSDIHREECVMIFCQCLRRDSQFFIMKRVIYGLLYCKVNGSCVLKASMSNDTLGWPSMNAQ